MAIKVMKATVQNFQAMSAPTPMDIPPALFSAAPASATPITIAMEPVTIGGSTLSSAALPMRMMRKPMPISKTAVRMMPTCTICTPSGQ